MIKEYIQNPLFKFLAKFLGLMLLWELVYTFWLEKNRSLDAFLTQKVAQLSIHILSNWYQMAVEVDTYGLQRLIIDNTYTLRITHACNGLILMVLFAVFLICFIGDWLLKVITIGLGIFFIYLINVVRVVALVLIEIYAPQYLSFSHHWLFTAIVYGFVFAMWLLWINKLSKIKLIKS
jgi:exosortase family protein XrtF